MKSMRTKKHFTTKNVLMVLFVLMLLIPYGTTGISLMVGMQQQLRANASASMVSDLEMLQDALDEMLVEAERVSYLHLVDNSIASILRTERTSYDFQYYTDEDGVKHGMNELIDVPKNSIIGAELTQLMHSYNALVERLTQSTEQEYRLRLEQQQATMRALENQVNPHFLYNSLNLIASLTQLGETDTIHTVTLNLADVMRYCIKGGSLVTLEEELCQTGKYIFIMGKRFPDRLTISLSADPALNGCRIPKLLLQPLIENSVIYGLDSSVQHLHMNVDVHREGGDLVMTVEDDGPGIDPAKLDDILGRIEAFNASRVNRDEQNGSIGLFNVHARVFARYGAGYGVTINSCVGCCRVVVRLPADQTPA